MFTFTQHDGYVSDLHLVVTKANKKVWSGDLTTREGRPGAPASPQVHDFVSARRTCARPRRRRRGRDIAQLDERGSYCCSHTVIIGVRGDGAFNRSSWTGGATARPRPPRSAGEVLVAGDDRLDERYTPHVLSFTPVRIWRYDHGTVTDVSKQQPLIVTRDLSRSAGEQRRAAGARITRRSTCAACSRRSPATSCCSASAPRRRRRCRPTCAAGKVKVASAGGPLGAKFPPALLALLGKLGY